MGFGEVLRALRVRLSWTQAELAERAKLSGRTVTALESGRVRPRPGTARMLADALELDGPDRERFLAAAGGSEDQLRPEPPAAAVTPVPAQLPADITDFAGRAGELTAMDALLPVKAGTAVAVLAGAAGVGKTALAVRWAHRVAPRFPDGQMYVDLRGFAPGQPVRPVEALAGFLRALGVPAGQIPPREEAAAALYRSLLAGRRMLVVLDNAADADQVRPLLPGGTGSLVLVTSRHLLTGLVVSHGAGQQKLAPLTAADAIELLTRILGRDKVAAEPDAAAALVRECSCLPLALRIAAANVRTDQHLDIAGYVAELRTSDRLTPLSVDGDPAASVRTALDWSYEKLSPLVRRLFRLLGLVPGPDVTPEAAAALTGAGVAEAARSLRVLADAHLLDRRAHERYAFHDLLRAYAAEKAHAADGAADRDTALRRLLDWYLHGAAAAAELLAPTTLRLPTPPPMDAVPAVHHDDRAAALSWLDAERCNLVAAVTHAAEHGPREPAWRLGDALRGYLDTAGHMVDWMTVAHATATAAAGGGDPGARAAAASHLANVHNYAGDYVTAIEHATAALSLSRRAGWTASEARALNQLGVMHAECGRLDLAADLLEEALRLDRHTHDGHGAAARLHNLGVTCAETGQLAKALDYLRQALDAYRRSSQSATWALANLGRVQRLSGALDAAARTLTRAISLARAEGGRRAEAFGLAVLSEVDRDRGQLPEARQHADAAEAIARDVGSPMGRAWAHISRAAVDVRAGRPESAAARYEQVLEMADEDGFTAVHTAALVGLAVAQRHLGQFDDAVIHADRGLKLAEAGGYRIYAGDAHTTRAEIHLARHRRDNDPASLDAACAAAEQALALQRRTGHRIGEAHTLIALGAIAHAADSSAAAAAHWRTALALCDQLGMAGYRAELRTLLAE